jgi:hypothetical protein
MKINIGKQRADTSTLNRAFFILYQPSIFQHTRSQPLLYEAYNAPVSFLA